MYSWSKPFVSRPSLTPPPLALFDTADGRVTPVMVPEGRPATMYVCGITPYDATHLGHAATYVTFDLIHRQLLARGHDVVFVENVTDIDDPLFERASRDSVEWQDLAATQVELFRTDMGALKVLPPAAFVAVTEVIDDIVAFVAEMLDKDVAYVVDSGEGHADIYAPVAATQQFGYVSRLPRPEMEAIFAERGGDPTRPGKRDPLDALVWRAHRDGEPAFEAPFGAGRPGWHIGCATITRSYLGESITIQGGGCDLVFPHHEFSAAHIESVTGTPRLAGHYVHTGMIGLEGTKMSKSLGNLVFVSKLLARGVEPSAIRLSLIDGHYRSDRDFSEAGLRAAQRRLAAWRHAAYAVGDTGLDEVDRLLEGVAARLADDLDTPAACVLIDEFAAAVADAPRGPISSTGRRFAETLDALLGVSLLSIGDELAPAVESFIADLTTFATGSYLREEDKQFWEPPYDQAVVNTLRALLVQFVSDMQVMAAPDDPEATEPVLEAIVADIRRLNSKTGWALIEEEESDELSEIIRRAARAAGNTRFLLGQGQLGQWCEPED